MKKMTLTLALILALAFTTAAFADQSTVLTKPAAAPEAAQDLSFLKLEAEPWTPKTCTATYDCGDGNVVSCTGNSSCQVFAVSASVRCDGGAFQYCPNRCVAYLDCGYRCGTIQCTSGSGNCSMDPPSCNGWTLSCSFCPDYPDW